MTNSDSQAFELISTSDFQGAVSHAKAVAASIGKKELNPALLRAGFLAYLQSDASLQESALCKLIEPLKDSCVGITLPTTNALQTSNDIKLPISGRLKQLLERKYQSVTDFVNALMEDGSGLNDADAEIYRKVIARATGFAKKRKSGSKISGEVLGVAGYFCHLAGDFSGHPGLSMHASFCSENIAALVKRNNWTEAHFKPGSTPEIDIDTELAKTLAAAVAGPVIATLDMAANAGARIIAQRVTAIHEAGHAVASFILRPQMPVVQLSIVLAAGSDGRTVYDYHSSYVSGPDTIKYFREELITLLAGGIAQQIAYGDDYLDSGSISDIERATELAWTWVARLGMDDGFGPIALPALIDAKGYENGFLQWKAQRAVQRRLIEARDASRDVLRENWRYVEELANLLLERKILNASEVANVFLELGIAGKPGVCAVRSRALIRKVKFALTNGVLETREGPVSHKKGDALVTGDDGERWPITLALFRKKYEPVGDYTFGQDGDYRKIQLKAIALRLAGPHSFILSRGRGALSGKAGDWILDYGMGDLSIVAEKQFEAYYELIDQENESAL